MDEYLKYEDFASQIAEKLQEKLGEKVQIRLHKITKNNGVVLDGMSICKKDGSVAPTIYLNDFYSDYLEGTDEEEILDVIAQIYEKSLTKISFRAEFYMDFEKVKDGLSCRLINREKNSALLSEVPHRDFLDLAMVVYYHFSDEQIGTGSIQVYDSHLENWKMDAQELLDLAWENTLRLFPEEFMSMGELLKRNHMPEEREGMREEGMRDDAMYVLTNRNNYFGAVYMTYDHILAKVGQELQDDFWILPSSVHECIMIPAGTDAVRGELEKMVREINRTEVDAEEFLSDHVYFYQRNMHRLLM